MNSPSSTDYDSLSLTQFIELSPIAIAHIDADMQVLDANQAFHSLTRDAFVKSRDTSLREYMSSEDTQSFETLFAALTRGEKTEPIYVTLNLASGDPIVIYTYASQLMIQDQPVIMLHMIDQTEQKNLEMRFAHSQKMQAVGQLAGGVAHDFNNLLTAMIGFCDLLLMRHPAGDASFADIMQIKQNANRAANLVRQLLAFSRRQTLQPKMLDITDVLAELSNLIRRLIGEHIDLNMLHGRDLGQVKADQGQLEQVIINLAVNARDAMPSGGQLRIESRFVHLAKAGLPHPDMIAPAEDDIIEAGDYILVEIADTGTGIDRAIVKQIFEPFFSTKEIGSGTGLGLATVYGIVKQTGGYVYVSTEQGKGTTFSLYFKRYLDDGARDQEAAEQERLADLTGGETILLVEDEAPVRMFAVRALRNKGYEVLEADCGEHALEVFESFEGDIDLIVTDVMMPGINGPTLIETLQSEQAERMQQVQVMFISGYAEDAFAEGREFHFLAKPFTLKQLAAKVKEVLTNRG